MYYRCGELQSFHLSYREERVGRGGCYGVPDVAGVTVGYADLEVTHNLHVLVFDRGVGEEILLIVR